MTNSDDMELENLIFSIDNLKLSPAESILTKPTNIDSYYIRYKLGIAETDLDSMCPQEKLDFCDYISKWRWGTSGSFFIGINVAAGNKEVVQSNLQSNVQFVPQTSQNQQNQQAQQPQQPQISIINVEKDIAYLSQIFPYKIIVYFAGESNCDYCTKVFSAGSCEKFITIPAIEINQVLGKYGICLRPLELFYRDPEFIDLDSIDICDF